MNFFKSISCVLLMVFVFSDLTSANLRMCGKSLDQFLEMMCINGFNRKDLRAKRFDASTDLDDNSISNELQPSAVSSYLMDKLYENPGSQMAKTRRRRHDGVAEECCRKSCTLPELLSYCL